MFEDEIDGRIIAFVVFIIVAFTVGTLFGDTPFGSFLINFSLILIAIGIVVVVLYFLLALFIDLGGHDDFLEEMNKNINKEQYNKILKETWFFRRYGSIIVFVLLSLVGQIIIWQTLGKILSVVQNGTFAIFLVVVMIFYEIAVFKITKFIIETKLKVLFQGCQISNLSKEKFELNNKLNPKKNEVKEAKYSKKVKKEIELIKSLGKQLR